MCSQSTNFYCKFFFFMFLFHAEQTPLWFVSHAAICPQGCRNGGLCVAPGICSCTEGWLGGACHMGEFPKTDNVLLCTFDETGLKNNRGVSDVRSRVMTPILMLALHWEHLFLMIKSFSFHPVPVLSALLTTLHHSHTSAFYIPDFSLCTLDLLFSLVYFQMSQHFTPLRPAAGVYDARIYKLFTHFPFPWFYK